MTKEAPPATTLYEADIATLLADLESVVVRLVAHRKVPPDARIEPLDPLRHVDAVMRLSRDLPCAAEIARQRMLGLAEEGAYCHVRSIVARTSTGVHGTVLIQADRSPAVAFVYGISVDRAWRHTWMTAFLKYSAIKHLHDRGVTLIRFQAAAHARDTHDHARRMCARIVG